MSWVENGNELDRRGHGLFTNRWKLHITPDKRIFVNSKQALKIQLLVVVDEEVIVTLGTLQILAKKHPPDVAHKSGIVDRILAVLIQSLRHEVSRRAVILIVCLGVENLINNLIPGFVLCEGCPQPYLPV